jgi:hypothetical protein
MFLILLILPLADAAFAQIAGIRESTAATDGHAANEIFGDEFIAENARSICRRAAELDPTDRFEFLGRWVLPGPHHPDYRVDGFFTQTDPSPLAIELEPAIHRSPHGATIVSPVLDLLDAASETGKLSDLRDSIAQTVEPDDEFHLRARTALWALVHLELGETEDAESAISRLHAQAAQAQAENLHEQWPETLVVFRGLRKFPDYLPVGDLLTLLYSQRTRAGPIGVMDEWHTQIVSLLAQYRRLGGAGALQEFIPVVRTRARSRGPGAAHARWEHSADNVIHHVAGHQEEYLFYELPLRGNFTVECDVGASGTTQFLTAGQFFGPKHVPDQLETGTFRDGAEVLPFAPPFSQMYKWTRCRAVFDDGTVTVFLNGRRVHEEPLPEHHDPWIGVRSWWRNEGRFRDFRIAGTPEVPRSVVISASRKLTGWLPYHDEFAGFEGAAWQWRSDPDSTGQIVGSRDPRLADSFSESLLRYQRPLDPTSLVEYDFFYEPGEVLTHPALDRLAFILHPEGVRVHWITDASHDRTPVAPDNLIDEPQHRRGPTPLPLNSGSWNHLKLSLREDVTQVELNGQRVFERPIEASNRRTFGLFHFADRTEVRVRNVVMRGDWGDGIPSEAQQELADVRVAELDARRDALPAVFTHDFREGVPDESFGIGGSSAQALSPTADGILADNSSSGRWAQATLRSRFSMEGDFDVEASFDRLDTGDPEGESTIRLTVNVDGNPRRRLRTERLRTTARGEHLKGQLNLEYPDGTNQYLDAFLPEESTSGRLRVTRRGDTATMLFAQGDSPLFRIIGTQTVGRGRVPNSGVQLIVIANDGGHCRVVWKDLTARAERIE